jgi:hypothetical protein
MRTVSAKSLLERIQPRMKELGLSDRDVGELSGHPDIIKNIKARAKDGLPYSPKMPTIMGLATALQKSPGWIMEEHDDGESTAAPAVNAEHVSAATEALFAFFQGYLEGSDQEGDEAAEVMRMSRIVAEAALSEPQREPDLGGNRALGRALGRQYRKIKPQS